VRKTVSAKDDRTLRAVVLPPTVIFGVMLSSTVVDECQCFFAFILRMEAVISPELWYLLTKCEISHIQ